MGILILVVVGVFIAFFVIKSNHKNGDERVRNRINSRIDSYANESNDSNVQQPLSNNINDIKTKTETNSSPQDNMRDSAIPKFPMNKTEVEEYILHAKSHESAQDQFNLGSLYHFGTGGIQQNYMEAKKWYMMSADKGYARAQHGLGVLYADGLGVSQDYDEAVKWFTKSAEQGFIFSQHDLGSMYFYGQGVIKDYQKAVNWLTKSAEQGHPNSQLLLGLTYALGKGVKQDFVTAYKWFIVGGEKVKSMAKAMDIDVRLLPAKMTSEQVKTAESLAQTTIEYIKKNGTKCFNS